MNKKRNSTPSDNSNFSPIPKLTCLVQNFNIPKPVIHPPGSDPYKFLTPSPHHNSGFKLMDPMILDPCVVTSRFEVVTKTTHLTASEHAGVFMDEIATKIVSTTISETPARPEIIAQQVVEDVVVVPTNKSDVVVTKIENDNITTPTQPNHKKCKVEYEDVVAKTETVVATKTEQCKVEKEDVVTKTESVVATKTEPCKVENEDVVTKTESVVATKTESVVATKAESKNGKFIICDVCKVTCNSELVFKRHLEGKIHLKNVIKLPVSSVIKQETSPLVVNDTFDTESEKKNDLLQNGVSVNSLFYCSIPPLGADNQTIPNVATEQVITPLHMEQLLNPALMSTNAGDLSNGGIQKGDNNFKDSETIVVPPAASPIISMQTIPINPTPVTTNTVHLSNGGTQKGDDKVINLKDSEKFMVPPAATPVISMQMIPIANHVDDLKSTESNIGGSGVQWCDVCKVRYVSDSFNTHQLGKKHLKNLNKPNDASSLQCELCGVCCKTCNELNKHKLGKKHLKNLKRSEQQIKIPASNYNTLSSCDEESKVVNSESSKRKANESLASEEENGDAKKQKMEEEVGSDAAMIPCNVCNVVCTGFVAFKSHLSSKEHSTMALKQVNVA